MFCAATVHTCFRKTNSYGGQSKNSNSEPRLEESYLCRSVKLNLRETDFFFFFLPEMVQNKQQAEKELFMLKGNTKPNEWFL